MLCRWAGDAINPGPDPAARGVVRELQIAVKIDGNSWIAVDWCFVVIEYCYSNWRRKHLFRERCTNCDWSETNTLPRNPPGRNALFSASHWTESGIRREIGSKTDWAMRPRGANRKPAVANGRVENRATHPDIRQHWFPADRKSFLVCRSVVLIKPGGSLRQRQCPDLVAVPVGDRVGLTDQPVRFHDRAPGGFRNILNWQTTFPRVQAGEIADPFVRMKTNSRTETRRRQHSSHVRRPPLANHRFEQAKLPKFHRNATPVSPLRWNRLVSLSEKFGAEALNGINGPM